MRHRTSTPARHGPATGPLPCILCGSISMSSRDRCQQCGVSTDWSRRFARHQGDCWRILTVLGAPGVGKTTFLGLALDLLSRRPDGVRWLAQGTSALRLQETAIADLSVGRFPEPTDVPPDSWSWTLCQPKPTKTKGKLPSILIPDLSGCLLDEELDVPQFFAVQALLSQASGAVLLLDLDAIEADRQLEQHAIRTLEYLHDLAPSRGQNWSRRPLAIVMRGGESPDPDTGDAADDLSRAAPELAEYCQRHQNCRRLFRIQMCPATASLNQERRALRVEPRGLVAPFDWLLQRIAR